jgi:hypothetical protein
MMAESRRYREESFTLSIAENMNSWHQEIKCCLVLGPVGCSLLNRLVVPSAVTVLQIVEKS